MAIQRRVFKRTSRRSLPNEEDAAGERSLQVKVREREREREKGPLFIEIHSLSGIVIVIILSSSFMCTFLQFWLQRDTLCPSTSSLCVLCLRSISSAALLACRVTPLCPPFFIELSSHQIWQSAGSSPSHCPTVTFNHKDEQVR